KEEARYFPALREAGADQGIQDLLREHQEGRDRIARMDAALAQGEAGRGGFAQTAHEYAHTLRHHIHDEDTRVFPEGDRALPPQAQADLLERFARFEEEVIGGGTHERLHAMLDRFQQKFGKEGHAGHGHDAHSHGTHHPHA
ncbi:MAG TPA: hemerythrin domain-containing protein, partial [Candidatus Limnocylindria bacterium]|nr:hemerythrin domain-containing protein [Candidatus Limnocylindria bacterium]